MLILFFFCFYEVILSQRIPVGRSRQKETFSTESEFEEDFFDSLINSTNILQIEDDLSFILINSNLSYTIINPDEPFEFIEHQYFWSENAFYEASENGSNVFYSYVCIFNTTNDKELFSQIHLPGGYELEQIFFGCESNKECCGLKCCGDDVVVNIIIVAAISVALLFLLVCNILIGFKKRRGVDSRKNNTAVMYEVERTHETLENGEEIDARQITLQTRNPENLTASYHPNHIS